MKRAALGILVLLALLLPTGTVAATPDSYEAVAAQDSMSGTKEFWPNYCIKRDDSGTRQCLVFRIEDPFCGTDDQQFRVVLYRADNYQGDRVVLCRSQKNFCHVPFPATGCYILCCPSLNDEVSSVAVGDITAAGACLRIYDNQDYDTSDGRSWLYEGRIYPNMQDIPGGIGRDKASSLKRVFAGSCP